MAQWYCIPNENYIDLVKDWSYHMIIAPHLTTSEKYLQFYIQNGDHLNTIIDNGLWEGCVISNADLLAWANKLHCDEIIAPDDISGIKTVKMTKEFLAYLKKNKQRDDFLIHGVIHGVEFKERIACLHNLVKLGVDIIDLPKMIGPTDRATFLKLINKEYPMMEVHFLGFYEQEVEQLADCEYPVRSFDTSVPFKPVYEEKFNIHLPDTWWNRFKITRNVKRFQKRYYIEGCFGLQYCNPHPGLKIPA